MQILYKQFSLSLSLSDNLFSKQQFGFRSCWLPVSPSCTGVLLHLPQPVSCNFHLDLLSETDEWYLVSGPCNHSIEEARQVYFFSKFNSKAIQSALHKNSKGIKGNLQKQRKRI